MKTTAAVVAAFAAGVNAQSSTPTVTTPTSLVQCQPAQFTVSGGTAPYFLSILPGGETGAAPLENLPTQNTAGAVTWTVDLQAGTAISVQVRDSTGALNYSQQVTVQPGSSTSCVGSGGGSGGGGAGASSAGAGTGASAPAGAGASSAAGGADTSAAGASVSSRASVLASSANSIASTNAASASAALTAISSRASSLTASIASSASAAASPSTSAASGADQFTASGAVGVVGAVLAVLFA